MDTETEPPIDSDRRQFLTVAAVGAATAIAGCASPTVADDETETEASTGIDDLPESVGLETVAAGLDFPVAIQFAPEDDRRYVAERDGRVLAHESDGWLDEPVLDLRETVLTDGERGLLGLALHPDFAENRRFFVHYSAPRREGTPEDYDHTGVVAEFEATDDGGRAEPDSERTVLEIPQPEDYHNGGDIAFGPEGYFYVALGEGGDGGGQGITEDLRASILRIDVDERTDERGYGIPDDNPLVDREGVDEYYAWGFRNPWRISFDDEDFFVADVGESDYEEVNLVEKGGNYGWNVKEGTHCFREDECPDESERGEPLVDPIVEYPHDEEAELNGVSVIGGNVYRGSDLPELEGVYVFGDLLARGRLFAAVRPAGDGGDAGGDDGGDDDDGGDQDRDRNQDQPPQWPTTVIDVDEDAGLERILSFGRDDDGEVYLLGFAADGGGLYRIVPAE